MVYRIDIQHFLTHAIDHFTRDELAHFQYAIISAKLKNGSRAPNVAKIVELYPSPEVVIAHAEYKDKKILEKMQMEELNSQIDTETGNDPISNRMYETFVNPLLKHHDIVIICDQLENDYIDVICKYLKKNFEIEVIDLNELFTKGRIGSIYIDRDEIWDKAVDVRRSANKMKYKFLESSHDGKLKLLGIMTKKQKIAKLEELGINVTDADKKNLDKLLIDEWVENDNDEGIIY